MLLASYSWLCHAPFDPYPLKLELNQNKYKAIFAIGCFFVLLGSLIFVDYLGATIEKQVPRFAYEKEWGEDEIVYKAPFYRVIRHNYDTEYEYIEVIH